MSVHILVGDVREKLAELPDESVHCIVTSPPYFGLRDYRLPPQVWGGEPDCEHDWRDATARDRQHYPEINPSDKQKSNKGSHQRGVKPGDFCRLCAWRGSIGLEPIVDLYVDHLVEVFRVARRALRADGTLWLNLGDSYAGSWGAQSRRVTDSDDPSWHGGQIKNHPKRARQTGSLRTEGVKPKDLYGIPWLVAFALRADGWFLRRDVIWSKPNPMPESVTDRPTTAHEYLFLLSKSGRYYYDAEAIRERAETEDLRRPYGSEGGWALDGRLAEQRHGGEPRKIKIPGGWDTGDGAHGTINRAGRTSAQYKTIGTKGNAKTFRGGGAYTAGQSFDNSCDVQRSSHGNKPNPTFSRNKRSVWTVATSPYADAHFATFPPALIEPCILASCPVGGTVLDPFFGAGTTGLVADRLGRNCIGIELNPQYAEMAQRRIDGDAGMFSATSLEAAE